MTRALPLAALLALALGAAACTKPKASAPGARLRQPASVAVFNGVTLQAPTTIHPYLAIANASRNDLSVIDAATDLPVAAPIKLRALVIPVDERPSILAAASLGDDTPEQRHADLLVAVSAGDSVLQVVETWNSANTVHSDDALAVDLGHSVIALAPVPSVSGRARIAAVLADARVAIVEYERSPPPPLGDGESIVLVTSTAAMTEELPFQPRAIAAMPGPDPLAPEVGAALYVASVDPVCVPLPGQPTPTCASPAVLGVAELSADLSTVRVLGARAPTRLVAAARLQERKAGDVADPIELAASASSTTSAFENQDVVPRVYAVLDESGCGPAKAIDCGVVVLDPEVASGAQAIPPDYAGYMPYRAPMRVPGRPLALAVSGPPKISPDETKYPAGFMRVYMGTIERATTAVAAVASDNGYVYFLDLGRFEMETSGPAIAARSTASPSPTWVTPPLADPDAEVDPANDVRLWIQKPYVAGDPVLTGDFVNPDVPNDLLVSVTTTPGFTPVIGSSERFTLTWQGYLATELIARLGEVGIDAATSQLALALQVAERPAGGSTTFTQVVKLWHPALGIRPNDILVFKVGGMPAPAAGKPACVGTEPVLPPGTTTTLDLENEFEVRIGDLLPPSDAHPGGALSLVRPDVGAGADQTWVDCYDVLTDAATGTSLVSNLRVTFRAQGLVLTGQTLGYAGRPELGSPPKPAVIDPPTPAQPPVVNHFELAYPATAAGQPWAEDVLAAACPLADWDGSFPADVQVLTCDATCRAACEQLVLGRKVRRLHNLSVDCATNPDVQAQTTCASNWPADQYKYPIVNGPALGFQVAVQKRGDGTPTSGTGDPIRDMKVVLTPESGVFPVIARQSGTSPYGASGAIAFDRTPWADAAAGYRFYVSYPADFVIDASPGSSGSPVPSILIR